MSAQPPHLLHVFSTFVPAGPEMRTVRLIEACGRELRHSIVAIDGRTSASEQLPRDVQVDVLASPPRAGSLATVRALRACIRRLRPDLVLSYNWGAFDAVFASASLLRRAHVHHEDGFTSEELGQQKGRRVLARRLLLPRVHRVIVPSKKLLGIARSTWKLAPEQVLHVPNGIHLERFARADGRAELRAKLGIPRDALVVGSVGHLRPEKNPLRLLKAAARIDPELDRHVLILGEGSEREALEALAAKTPTLFGRVHFAGHQADPRDFYRAMDVFALSSDTEQMPVALLEAMACSLPVVATDVGDVRDMLPEEQGAFVVPLSEHETAWPFAEKLTALLRDPERRARLGAQNRARVEERYSFAGMLAAYRAVYAAALRA